jgi:hypothetical protein
MKKLLLFLISLCGVLTGCQRMPSEPVTYTPADTVEPGTTLPDTLPQPDTVRQGPNRPPTEYKLLYGVRPTPYEQKRLAEDSLKNAKE